MNDIVEPETVTIETQAVSVAEENATNRPNIPPADELYQVRASIKDLQAREVSLKNLMLTDPSARTGNSYIAEVKDVQTTRVDLKELRSMYPTAVAEYTFAMTEKRVVLKGINDDGEIIAIPRKPTAERTAP